MSKLKKKTFELVNISHRFVIRSNKSCYKLNSNNFSCKKLTKIIKMFEVNYNILVLVVVSYPIFRHKSTTPPSSPLTSLKHLNLFSK